MKRAPIVLAATVAGLAATVAFQAHPATAVHSTASASAGSASSPAAASSAASTTTASSASATSSSSSSKTATGAVAANQYGNVQLKVTVKAGKLTQVEAVQIPNGDPKSAEINAYAEPLLQQSALTAQSANVDAVSGATYTSDSYKSALQSALDKVGFTTSSSSTS